MVVLVVMLMLVLLVAVLTGNSHTRKKLQDLENRFDALTLELRRQQRPYTGGFTRDSQPLREPEAPKPEAPPEPEPQAGQQPHRRPLPQPDPPLARIPPPAQPLPEPVAEARRKPAAAAFVPPPPTPPAPGFFERHPDLEKFIGENLISKIGIAILVIGIGFFVKFAIDQQWIGPAGRVAIGMLCGGILIGLAHKLHTSYKAFSSVLVGGGLAVCYFTIALAYQDYRLMSQPLAFGIMILLTAFACVLAMLYDRQEVAIIALAGGFASPFLVSDGSGNYIVLFSYLLVLNAGLLLIAYRKSWRLLNGIAFFATALLFCGWLLSISRSAAILPYRGGFWFATAFYLLFLAINLAHNIRHRDRFVASDFSIILANTALFFGGGLYMLDAGGLGHYRGLFAICLAVLNLGLTAALAQRKAIDKSVLYLLIGITLSFVSLTAPLQLHGHSITLFWAAETVVILWMFKRTGFSILQAGMMIVWAGSLISLLLDWDIYYFSAPKFPIIFNRGFLTTLYVSTAQFLIWYLSRRGKVDDTPDNESWLSYIRVPALLTGSLLAYAAGALEIFTQITQRATNSDILVQYLLFYTLACACLALFVTRKYSAGASIASQVTIIVPGFLFYLCSYIVYADQESAWMTYGRFAHFSIHWLSLAIMIMLAFRLARLLRSNPTPTQTGAIRLVAALLGLLAVSVETGLLLRVLLSRDWRTLETVDGNYVRIGLPIVWGLYSFALMWIGMRNGQRMLRIISLSIFSFTLLKLFLVDIRNLGPGGKIAAFCSLGVLLLVVSFMYQRLRRLIIDDKSDEKTEA